MADWADEIAHDHANSEFIVVGHSMGGMAALALADRHPGAIAGMVIVSSQASAWDVEQRRSFIELAEASRGWSEEFAGLLAELLTCHGFASTQADWLADWTREVGSFDRTGMMALVHAIADRPSQETTLARLDAPALVVHGLGDQAVAPALGRALADSSDRATFIGMSECGHCPPLEQPNEFSRILTTFLRAHFPFPASLA